MKNNYVSTLKYKQDELATNYIPAVKAMAYRLKERLPHFIELSDLISVGNEELIKLARRYDSSINDSFWGYARTRVNGAMLDYLRSLDVISKNNRKIIKQIDAETTKYYNEHQEEPSDEHLVEVLQIDLDKVKKAKLASAIYTVLPIDEGFENISEGGEDILQSVIIEELLEIIHSILSGMDEREQMIIQLYYFEELNLSEISKILNITESRISQINKEIIRRIKYTFENRKIHSIGGKDG